jgi:hypothetical protein
MQPGKKQGECMSRMHIATRMVSAAARASTPGHTNALKRHHDNSMTTPAFRRTKA